VTQFQYPAGIIATLREEWEKWYPREGVVLPLPDDECLVDVLEVAYHASFTVEEHRPTKLTLLLVDGPESDGPPGEPGPFLVTVHGVS
jgi:hypothetical protein